MKERYKSNIKKINSLQDLQSERARISEELSRTEEGIQSNYHNLLQTFSLRNLLTTVSNDFALASTAVSKTISFGKMLLGKVKKKKKKEYDAEPDIN